MVAKHRSFLKNLTLDKVNKEFVLEILTTINTFKDV